MNRRPSGRRRAGVSGTREAILRAARSRFGDVGFTATTIRAVAADAGVDPALVMHYFGTKADLFAAAMQLPMAPSGILPLVTEQPDRDRLGETILRTLLGLWEDPDTLSAWLGMVRSAASDDRAARMLREFITQAVLDQVASLLDTPDRDYRVSLVASQIVGLGVARYIVGLEPLASATSEELVAAVAPTLQRYLTDPIDA